MVAPAATGQRVTTATSTPATTATHARLPAWLPHNTPPLRLLRPARGGGSTP